MNLKRRRGQSMKDLILNWRQCLREMSWRPALELHGMILQELKMPKDFWRKLLFFHYGCPTIS
ncbi:hypothetical protein MKW92_025128, partial [Papaver armeniacum]